MEKGWKREKRVGRQEAHEVAERWRTGEAVNPMEKTETMIGMQKAIDNRGVIKG